MLTLTTQLYLVKKTTKAWLNQRNSILGTDKMQCIYVG
jgi:hypothetical protein